MVYKFWTGSCGCRGRVGPAVLVAVEEVVVLRIMQTMIRFLELIHA